MTIDQFLELYAPRELEFTPPRPRTEIDYFPRWNNQSGEGWAIVEIVGSGWSPGVMQDFNGSGA